MPKFYNKNKDSTCHKRALIKYAKSFTNQTVEACNTYTTSVNTGVCRASYKIIKWSGLTDPGSFEVFWDKWDEDIQKLMQAGSSYLRQ